MMIIAESGSTKTDWIILKNGRQVNKITTLGFNPNYFSPALLENSVEEVCIGIMGSVVKKVFFYGSGCSSVYSKKIVSNVILQKFPQSSVEVYHDLFGAACALFGHGKGIASVLGTGSSSCLFDDGRILEVVPSLGYLFADEGSGFQIGKKLLRAAFNHEFPGHLQKQIDEEFSLDLSGFLTKVYTDPKPNSVIAAFTPFAVKNRNEPFIKDLVRSVFDDFFRENIIKYTHYQQYSLGFVGSVAFLFKDELEFVTRKFDLKTGKVIKNPIEELVKFHLE
jgi:N-acetylglucosamine kinase-like BadF-type ATPase